MLRASIILRYLLAVTLLTSVLGFSVFPQNIPTRSITTSLASTFAADGSEYSADNSDLDDDDDSDGKFSGRFRDEDETPTVELQPIPMSKNAGNRFVTIIWDRDHYKKGTSPMQMHDERVALTEDHVFYCRKASLYNETFNSDSPVDVLWSLPILSSDLKRLVGHAICTESKSLKETKDFLANEPIIQKLTGGDGSSLSEDVPLYRWRHIRDYTLRIDDGRHGYPCMCMGFDDEPEAVGGIRDQVRDEMLEYLIRSSRVIAAGPLHLPTEFKDDPSSIPVGDFILFNAKNRDDAIEFAESLPTAKSGLYKDLRVNFYNSLDTTGKFVSEDSLREARDEMKVAMTDWGYPTGDDQTPWLNG